MPETTRKDNGTFVNVRASASGDADDSSPDVDDSNSDGDTPLPEDFPARETLVAAGYDTTAAVEEASDEDLLALDHLGDKTLGKIRNAQ
jgi:hypothetical protein